MSDRSKIQWTDASWTPIKARNPQNGKAGWHCVKLSPACAHCYSETFNARGLPNGGTGLPFSAHSPAETYLDESVLMKPLKWRKPRKVFVCSMTDLFGEWVPDEMIDRVFAAMALSSQHTFQVLTKRAARMKEYFSDMPTRELALIKAMAPLVGKHGPFKGRGFTTHLRDMERLLPLPNVWLGVSVENQKYADERIPLLIKTPAEVRFLSCEPLLGPLDLTRWIPSGSAHWQCQKCGSFQRDETYCLHCRADAVYLSGSHVANKRAPGTFKGWVNRQPLDQVIIGGESGHGARECKFEWIRSLLRQCKEAGCAAFVKQLGKRPTGDWGPNPPTYTVTDCSNGQVLHYTEESRYKNGVWKLVDKKGGWIDEFPEDMRIRNFPEVSSAAR